jgi:hypothetical protein
MSPIEIDPKTGAPIIKSKTDTTGFAVHEPSNEPSNEPEKKIIDPITANLIEEAKKSNAKLTLVKEVREKIKEIKIPVKIKMNQREQIKAILKNGMDTRQQEVAFNEIMNVLDSE